MAEQTQGIDMGRVLDKVQQDPMGALLVKNALQSCYIEDQNEMIEDLKSKLVELSKVPAENSSDE